jgi:uncharacterized protein YciI
MSALPTQYWIIATDANEDRAADLALRGEQLAHDHHAYIDRLDQRGILFAHGAARDELDRRAGTGLIVIAAATRAEAEAIALEEPYIAGGFRTLKLVPWRARLGRLVTG